MIEALNKDVFCIVKEAVDNWQELVQQEVDRLSNDLAHDLQTKAADVWEKVGRISSLPAAYHPCLPLAVPPCVAVTTSHLPPRGVG